MLCRYLAKVYSGAHKTMAAEKPISCGGDDFTHQGGITNGAAWYSVAGGMFKEEFFLIQKPVSGINWRKEMRFSYGRSH